MIGGLIAGATTLTVMGLAGWAAAMLIVAGALLMAMRRSDDRIGEAART